jgi:hypothetical protein
VSAGTPPFDFMERLKPADRRPRLSRTLWFAVIFVIGGCLGMFLAGPVVGHFHRAAPWVLPAIAVGILTVLAVVALTVLPKITSRGA